MAIDDATSTGKPATPSLLAGRTSLDERDSKSSRILASLEGRAAEPERQHLPIAEKRSRRGLLLLLLLLLVGAGAGLAYWRTAQHGSVIAVAQGNGTPSATSAPGAAAVTSNGAAATASGASTVSSTGTASVVTPGSSSAAASSPASSSVTAAAPSTAAAITDAPPAGNARTDEAPPATNPLSALASAAPAPAAASTNAKTSTPANDSSGAAAKGKAASKNTHAASKSKKKSDGDAALLSALFAYGLPAPSKTDNTAVLPGTPLSERLQMCRRKPFLESEQCRLQVCAGQWGIAPECPNPQAQTHN